MSESITGKPKLSRKQLRGHGIDFNEKVLELDELDSWLQPIARAVTRLQGHFRKATRTKFIEELTQFHHHGQDRDDARKMNWCLRPIKGPNYLEQESYATSPTGADDPELAICTKALLDVRICRTRNENEQKWTHVLREHIFLDFHKVIKDWNSYEQKLNGWELHQDVLWNEFPQWAKLNPEIARVTRPKPDLTYGFPIISPDDKIFGTLKGDHQVDSFSLPVLGELRNRQKESLISAPTTALYRWATKKKVHVLEAKDLMCFPWAIVEVKRGTAEPVADKGHTHNEAEAKRHERRTQFCYCQAANASAAGLTMREHLAAMAGDTSNLHNTRVMFSFTCVGSAVKLWTTYREKPDKHNKESQAWRNESRITMVCIWATSLELSWGIIALRMIVKNVKDWVYARIKPEISRWIHDVRQNRLQIHCLTPSGDEVVQRRRAASCEPSNEMVGPKKLVSPTLKSRYRIPQGKARPGLPHGQTAPASFDRRLAKASVPRIQLNGLAGPDEGGTDDSSDEGYASIHTNRWCESEKDEDRKLSAFICNDEPSEDDSDASYVPPDLEDESTESESVEDEESDDDGASSGENSSGREENGDDYDLSDSEGHGHQLNHKSCAFRRLEVYCTPTKGHKLCKPTESGSKRDRRRSSRF